VLVVAAALGYCAYAPDNIEKWVPAAGGLAHWVHDQLASATKARASAPAAAIVQWEEFPSLPEGIGSEKGGSFRPCNLRFR